MIIIIINIVKLKKIKKILLEILNIKQTENEKIFSSSLNRLCKEGKVLEARNLILTLKNDEEIKIRLNQKDLMEMTCFHWATISGNLQLLEYLIKKGADCTALSKSGDSALIMASRQGPSHNHIMKYLIEKYDSMTDGKKIINQKNKNNQSALMYTILTSNISMFCILEKYYSNKEETIVYDLNIKQAISVFKSKYLHKLFESSKTGDIHTLRDTLDTLCNLGENEEEKKQKYWIELQEIETKKTILHYSVERNDLNIMNFLLEKQPDLTKLNIELPKAKQESSNNSLSDTFKTPETRVQIFFESFSRRISKLDLKKVQKNSQKAQNFSKWCLRTMLTNC